jgi:hypothetical protein
MKMSEKLYNARIEYNKAQDEALKFDFMRKTVLSRLILEMQNQEKVTNTKAEHIARSCRQYEDFIDKRLKAKRLANDKYAEVERLQYEFKENESESYQRYQQNKLTGGGTGD